MKNRKVSIALLASLLVGCYAEVDEVSAEAGEAPAPAPVTGTPDHKDDATVPSNCYPDIAYELGGEWIMVPGFCVPQQFVRPAVGDPDPSMGSKWLKDVK